MADLAPPYLNKFIDKLKKECLYAEKRELRAKKNLEFATAYKELCENKLKEAENNEQNK